MKQGVFCTQYAVFWSHFCGFGMNYTFGFELFSDSFQIHCAATGLAIALFPSQNATGFFLQENVAFSKRQNPLIALQDAIPCYTGVASPQEAFCSNDRFKRSPRSCYFCLYGIN